MQKSQAPEMPSQLQDFAGFVNGIMKDWKIQGLAIAIIKDGEVIFSLHKSFHYHSYSYAG